MLLKNTLGQPIFMVREMYLSFLQHFYPAKLYGPFWAIIIAPREANWAPLSNNLLKPHMLIVNKQSIPDCPKIVQKSKKIGQSLLSPYPTKAYDPNTKELRQSSKSSESI